MPVTAQITIDEAGHEWVEVRFPFNRLAVEDLKDAVPGSVRRWIPERRCWYIEPDWWEEALSVLQGYFNYVPDPWEACFRERAKQPPHQDPPQHVSVQDGALATLYLQPGAPAPLITAAYRVLAKLWHPDVGGSNEQMRALNIAYEALREFREGN